MAAENAQDGPRQDGRPGGFNEAAANGRGKRPGRTAAGRPPGRLQ